MMKSGRILLLLVLALFVLSQPVAPLLNTAPAAFAASREPVRARNGMVASTSGIASRIGADVLKRGGNAVDAAIAVAFALAVVYPAAGNLGGGGFMMIRLKDGRATAIDYREMAPKRATRNVYLDERGELIKGEGSSTLGYRAAGVPGTVRGMELALKKYGSGRMSWAELLAPARRLAATGFPVSFNLARSLRDTSETLGKYEDSRRIFLNQGRLYKEGDTIRQPELAATLARVALRGPNEFYEGETARLIVEDMKRHNGLMTMEDLRGYVAKEREPVRGSYRGFEIISMPPPSSGGVILLEMLNILEGFDLKNTGWGSGQHTHLLAETMRRAFADRAEYMGDPDFVRVPVQGLLDKEYAARLRSTIDLKRASASSEVRAGRPTGYESSETTHFTVVDREGNAVSNTYTLNDSFGAKVTARGTGVILNNEMDDFAAKPGSPNLYGLIQGERNAVAPGKRPLSAMTPTFVIRRDGTLWFAVGSPGGPRIINAVFQVIVNVIDYRMNIQQAIDAPRIHQQWLPDEVVYEPFGLSDDTRRVLEAMGHKFKLTTEKETKVGSQLRFMGDAQGVMIEEGTGVRLGASDSRNWGEPAGY
ncbi:MAG TPA: gamma-glutamyltransferase [Pyrinomonadaceae bacterium]|jgi:gamma-glutamyltranspeptidase/glutathione hydrolase